jgi:hypothetical protein
MIAEPRLDEHLLGKSHPAMMMRGPKTVNDRAGEPFAASIDRSPKSLPAAGRRALKLDHPRLTPSPVLIFKGDCLKRALLAFVFTVVAAAGARADGTYPIYGSSFYGTGEEQTIKNGKGMYSVEMLYTKRYTNPSAEVSKLRAIAGKGFRLILRLDYDYGQTVPANWDWVGRYDYAVRCGQIARDMAGVVNLFVIGNEMTASYEGAIAPDWYTMVFNAYDTNSAYDKIKALRPDAQVLMGGSRAGRGSRARRAATSASSSISSATSRPWTASRCTPTAARASSTARAARRTRASRT